MQFLLIAHDGPDEGALDRRIAVREKHIALGDQMRANGNMLYGGALLDEAGQMIGSMLVLDFPIRQEVDDWLKIEPYVLGDVWRDIDVQPLQVRPSFVGLHL